MDLNKATLEQTSSAQPSPPPNSKPNVWVKPTSQNNLKEQQVLGRHSSIKNDQTQRIMIKIEDDFS